MTVATTYVKDFQRDEILKGAIRLCGLLRPGGEPKAEQYADAAEHFDGVMSALQADGVLQQQVERRTLALVAGTAEYTLPTEIFDIELGQDDTIATVYDTTSVETLIKTMSREEYLPLAVKTVQGRPARGFLEKHAAVKLVLWPVPDAVYTLRYNGVRYVHGGETGAVTMDVRRSWIQCIKLEIASFVAMDNSMFERSQLLHVRAMEMRQRCEAGDAEHGDIVIRVGHRARNW
jgi:hypothetical protein